LKKIDRESRSGFYFLLEGSRQELKSFSFYCHCSDKYLALAAFTYRMNFYKRLEIKDFSYTVDKMVRRKIDKGHIPGNIFRNESVSGFFSFCAYSFSERYDSKLGSFFWFHKNQFSRHIELSIFLFTSLETI
jgi:hypothetical protein